MLLVSHENQMLLQARPDNSSPLLPATEELHRRALLCLVVVKTA